MLYSKNGSVPKPETDGTDGWVGVEDPPIAPENMEVVWWCPPGWVVRPVMPVKENVQYKWSQSKNKWLGYPTSMQDDSVLAVDELINDPGSASDTIPGAN